MHRTTEQNRRIFVVYPAHCERIATQKKSFFDKTHLPKQRLTSGRDMDNAMEGLI